MDDFIAKNILSLDSYNDFNNDGYLSIIINDKDKYKYKKCMQRIDKICSLYNSPLITKLIIGAPLIAYKNIANFLAFGNNKEMEYFCVVYQAIQKDVKSMHYKLIGNNKGQFTISSKAHNKSSKPTTKSVSA